MFQSKVIKENGFIFEFKGHNGRPDVAKLFLPENQNIMNDKDYIADITVVDDWHDKMSLSFYVFERFRGFGCMTILFSKFCEYLFEKYPRIIIINDIDSENNTSIGFHKSFGFEYLGFHSKHQYSMNRELFEKTQEMRDKKIQGYLDKHNKKSREIVFGDFADIANNALEL